MMLINSFLNRLGEFNPQLFREIKGRLKYTNILLALLYSVVLQVLFCLLWLQTDPIDDGWKYIFVSLTIIFVFTLLVGGTYLIISDLCKEENQGTLNFIRLSPEAETSIFIGKMLGVPSLIYLCIITAIPLHLFSGFLAGFNIISLLGFYLLLIAHCALFYSAALLFVLFGKWFNNWKPWLGSSAVFGFIFINLMLTLNASENDFNNPSVWFRLFSPWDMTFTLFPGLFNSNIAYPLQNIQFFNIPIGKNIFSLFTLLIAHHIICIYSILQATARVFRNQKTTALSKEQSYLLTGFMQLMFLGLMMPTTIADAGITVTMLTLINSTLIILLVIFISPSSQDIQDWSRYSYQNDSKKYFKYFRQDLVWGEKSPATLAITINTLIATIPGIILIPLLQEHLDLSIQLIALSLLTIYVSLLLILSNIIQLIFLSRNISIYMWVFGSVGMTIFLPIMIGYLFKIPDIFNIFTVLLTNFAVLCFLNWKFNQQVRVLGESATKALLTGDR